MEADLVSKAPVFRVLDFLEEVLLASASGEPSEISADYGEVIAGSHE